MNQERTRRLSGRRLPAGVYNPVVTVDGRRWRDYERAAEAPAPPPEALDGNRLKNPGLEDFRLKERIRALLNGTANGMNGAANGMNGAANGMNGAANGMNGAANGTNGKANGVIGRNGIADAQFGDPLGRESRTANAAGEACADVEVAQPDEAAVVPERPESAAAQELAAGYESAAANESAAEPAVDRAGTTTEEPPIGPLTGEADCGVDESAGGAAPGDTDDAEGQSVPAQPGALDMQAASEESTAMAEPAVAGSGDNEPAVDGRGVDETDAPHEAGVQHEPVPVGEMPTGEGFGSTEESGDPQESGEEASASAKAAESSAGALSTNVHRDEGAEREGARTASESPAERASRGAQVPPGALLGPAEISDVRGIFVGGGSDSTNTAKVCGHRAGSIEPSPLAESASTEEFATAGGSEANSSGTLNGTANGAAHGLKGWAAIFTEEQDERDWLDQPCRPSRLEVTRPYGRPGGLAEPEPDAQVSLAQAVGVRFPDPRGTWIRLINAEGPTEDPFRSTNALDCSLAVISTWHGEPVVAAPRYPEYDVLGRPLMTGEIGGVARAEEWLGHRFEYVGHGRRAYVAIAQRLIFGGHGASAVLITRWPAGGSHAWNAVNCNGEVLWIDAQRGHMAVEPPYEEVTGVFSVVIDRYGQRL